MPDESVAALRLADYQYELPADRIADYPMDQRDQAKLLAYRNGELSHHQFFELSELLPEDSLVVFNDTRVIPARLILHRSTGARIEIFLLKPVFPREINKAMESREFCSWECMIGNKKKWKDGEVLTLAMKVEGRHIHLNAKLIDRDRQWVELSWDYSEFSFSELMGHSGKIPLPPYIKREATSKDEEQYQTVYSREDGAVAAPTAGLHFTDEVLEDLKQKSIQREFVTLHVSAGTFQPVKKELAFEHEMHAEQILFTQDNLKNLLNHLPRLIAVGTTSMRVLESLYWFGVQVLENDDLPADHTFTLHQKEPYGRMKAGELPTATQAIEAMLGFMEKQQLSQLMAETSIYIMPGYLFQMCRGLITNYHLPATTLILLVAAFIGEDWRKVYESALENEYRFLSYGDSSLLLPGS